MLGVIIQARMSSTRLPGKILLPFYKGESILELIINNIKGTTGLPVVVATTTNPKDDVLVDFLKSRQIQYYRGDEFNVLGRFINAARHYSFSRIIRICADNPFLDMMSLKSLIEVVNSNIDSDYISFKINNKPSIKTHFGFWSEYVSLKALDKICSQTEDSLYLEHVTNYLYEHETQFKIKWIDINTNWSKRVDIRLTTDTAEDFFVAKQIYQEFNGKCSIEDIIKVIDSNRKLVDSMKKQIINNSK